MANHNTYHNHRILTGDTPTGKLHLGHWVGSLENRIALQQEYECFFIIANMHAFTTNKNNPKQIRENVENIILDYLSVGIDPAKSSIFLQSEVPAIAELSFLFSMLVPLARILRNPTIKKEIRDKNLGDNYPFGFLLYPIGQVADVLAFRANLVPVGEDQIPHIELTREIARLFNQIYCNVDPQIKDENHQKHGGLLVIPEIKLGREKRLAGIGPPGKDGTLLKMSKSLNNAIFLSDNSDIVSKKVMQMYTDPKRLKATDPGEINNNPLWIFHRAFNPDLDWVKNAENLYSLGKIGDVECKKKLIEVLNDFLDPIRNKRAMYANDPNIIIDVLQQGTIKANEIAEETLSLVKKHIHQDFWGRKIMVNLDKL